MPELGIMFNILLTSVLGLLLIGIIRWLLSKFRFANPPYPPGPIGFPILGSLAFMDAVSPHISFINMANKYAKNGMFSVQLGSINTVVLIDPILIKKAFNNDIFSGRPNLYMTTGVMKGKGVIFSNGELWKDHRKLLSNWMRVLGAARGAMTRPRLMERMKSSADQLEQAVLDGDMDNTDLSKTLSFVMGNTIYELLFGISYKKDDRVMDWLLKIQTEAVEYMGVAAIVNFLPFLRFFSPWLRKVYYIITSGQTQTHKVIDGYVAIRQLRKQQGGGPVVLDEEFDKKNGIEFIHYSAMNSNPQKCYFNPSTLNVVDDDCVLDHYLEERERRKSAGDIEGFNRMSIEQMKFFMCDMFGAALDTSFNTLLWLILYLAMHQDEQEKIREELKTLCGEETPSLEHMPNATYTKAAICEIQRLRSVVPIGIPHSTLEDTIFNGYFIPKDTMIMPLQWYIHNDPTVWENPSEFKPSRFIGADGSLLAPLHFIPFQSGKRMCPGDEFARMAIFTYSTRLVSKYQFSLSKPVPSLHGTFGLTLIPPEYSLKLKPL